MFHKIPRLIRTPRARRLLSTVTATVAVISLTPAAASAQSTQCTVSTAGSTRPFSQYGDSSWYVLAPGGAFTSGTSAWTRDNAAIEGSDGTFAGSLKIQPSGNAVSASFCVGSTTPTFRFYDRQMSGSWSEMNVYVLWTNSLGQPEMTCAGGLSPSTNWSPTPIYNLGSMLPTEDGSTFTVRIEFVPASGGGAISLADVYVDPYNKG